MNVQNVYTDDWDHESEQSGFVRRRLRLGRRLGGELIGASVYELAPGNATWPYHLHHANEELMLVLEGPVVVRTPEGERQLATGDAMLFARGEEGAHSVRAPADAAARVLLVSTMVHPDIGEYPDSEKIGLFAGVAPGGPDEQVVVERFIRAEDVDYFDGEPPDDRS